MLVFCSTQQELPSNLYKKIIHESSKQVGSKLKPESSKVLLHEILKQYLAGKKEKI